MFNEDDYNAMLLDKHYDNERYVDRFISDTAKDYLNGCLECVYESGDVSKLEFCLEELCAVLGVSFDGGEIKIDKKDSLLQEWYKGYSQAMIDLQMEDEKVGEVK